MILCPLCPKGCILREGQTGACRARENVSGHIVPKGYGKLTSLALDPVEKKPLARFHPGSFILSAGSFGCNMSCFFCQNAVISFANGDDIPIRRMDPEELVRLAEDMTPRGNIGLAFTYNEPLLNHEYVRDCAVLLRERELKTVLVTNGCFNLAPLGDMLTLVDALNIDLKGFTSEWYARLGGDLETVKAFIIAAARSSHVELTTLVVPGENDSEDEIGAIASWIASVDPEIPLHLSRFFPRHKAAGYQNTDPAVLIRLCGIARGRLKHVYAGNI